MSYWRGNRRSASASGAGGSRFVGLLGSLFGGFSGAPDPAAATARGMQPAADPLVGQRCDSTMHSQRFIKMSPQNALAYGLLCNNFCNTLRTGGAASPAQNSTPRRGQDANAALSHSYMCARHAHV
eukprot:342956-Chlamydomonas_euryale.AAC.1